MTIPRSDNPTPIEFSDIRVGDTVERVHLQADFRGSDVFLVGGVNSRFARTAAGHNVSRNEYGADQTVWYLHRRPVGLPNKPMFGRLTWTTDMDHSVVAEWHSAHVFGPSNPVYAVSDLGHQIPQARVTNWEPGEFVPAGEGRIAANASCTPYCSSGGAL